MGHGHLCSLTFQEKLTICLQLITHIRERVIEWAMAKWPGLGKSTVQKVLTAGASHWQDYVNGGHGNEYRLKSPTCYGEAMKSVDTKLRELHEKNFGITKVDVLEKLQAACTGLTAQALQDRYEFFMRYYGWNWRRYARCTRLAPLDLDAKITNWAQTFFAMNRARNYEYAVCLDETSLLEEGSAHGWVICPRGSKAQPKIASNDEKKTVTVLFGTVTGESTSDSGDDSEDDSDEGRGEESSEEEGEDAAEPPPPSPKQLWVCAGCTFENEMNVKKCAMCKAYKAVV